MTDYAQGTLKHALAAVVAQLHSPQDAAVKAELIAQKQQLEAALSLLSKCAQYGVTSAANFTRLPPQQCNTPSSEYRIIEDCESDNPTHWREVKCPEQPFNHVRLGPSDVVIEC